ncbi:MAG: hypothetical protein ACYC0B_02255 [Gemmatimonadaceae bacterium]
MKYVRLTPEERLERTRLEAEQSRALRFQPLADDEEQAIARARDVCLTCLVGHTGTKELQHHNLRAAELGERSYPCTKPRS